MYAPHPALPPRFVLRACLGSGGFGEVWRAWDEESEREVAVKIVEVGPRNVERVTREVAALRHVNLPGVVRLLDAGRSGSWAWMAMDVVDGSPFPGGTLPVSWEWLEPRVEALLETLGRLHASGLIHRDLKPENVLVDAAGRPTILDLGLARGEPAGETITRTGAVMGTPQYMSPEQCRGRRVDARSDLYSVGLLIYQSLTGRLPHTGGEIYDILRQRASLATPPIRTLVPALPESAAACIDALLAVEPLRRPPTAEAALRLLRDIGGRPSELPLLGRGHLVHQALERIRAGQSVLVGGPRGSGRTRLVQEVANVLRKEGWNLLYPLPGRRPYDSLRLLFPGEPPESAIRRGLASLEGTRTVLVMDGLQSLDRWSRGLLEHSQVLASTEWEGDLNLEPLGPADLEPLFAGPERFFHLRTDAAALLWRRSNGLPTAVVAEIDGWTARGVATWEQGRLRLGRPDLERLEAGMVPAVGREAPATDDPGLNELLLWAHLAGPMATTDLLSRARKEPEWAIELQVAALEELGALRRGPEGHLMSLVPPRLGEETEEVVLHPIHSALADASSPNSPGRLRHLVASARWEEVAREVPSAAQSLLAEGRAAAAVGLLDEAITTLQGGELPGVADTLVQAAWADRTGEVMRRARYLATRLPNEPDLLPLLSTGTALDGQPHPNPAVEVIQVGLRLQASRGANWEQTLREAEAWAALVGRPEVEAAALGWRADFQYAHADFQAAAEQAERAARLAPNLGDRLQFLFRAGAVYLEEGDTEKVIALGTEIRETAASRRLPLHEARGEWLLRVVAERTGTAGSVDEEVIEAAEWMGDTSIGALLILTEARIAWRCGQLEVAQPLALRAAQLFRTAAQVPAALCAEALNIACGGTTSVNQVVADMEGLDRPDVTVEVLGLLAWCKKLPPGNWSFFLLAAADRLKQYRRDWPHGAMSVEQAMYWVQQRDQGWRKS